MLKIDSRIALFGKAECPHFWVIGYVESFLITIQWIIFFWGIFQAAEENGKRKIIYSPAPGAYLLRVIWVIKLIFVQLNPGRNESKRTDVGYVHGVKLWMVLTTVSFHCCFHHCTEFQIFLFYCRELKLMKMDLKSFFYLLLIFFRFPPNWFPTIIGNKFLFYFFINITWLENLRSALQGWLVQFALFWFRIKNFNKKMRMSLRKIRNKSF